MCFLPKYRSFFCCMSLKNGQLLVCFTEILIVAIISTQLYFWSQRKESPGELRLFMYAVIAFYSVACLLTFLAFFDNLDACIKVALIITFLLRILTLINILLSIFQLISYGDKLRLIDLLLAVLYTITASYALIGVNSYYHSINDDYEN